MQKVALYVRVSTTEQTTNNQKQLLNQIANEKGWEIYKVYEDNGLSGMKGRDKRPAFDHLCNDMVANKFQRILVWDISRLGRSLKHLVEFLHEVQKNQCELYIHQSGLDTTTAAGKMMFQMIGVFSEFERAMISERIKLGLNRVKRSGKKIGRPKTISKDLENQVILLKQKKIITIQILLMK